MDDYIRAEFEESIATKTRFLDSPEFRKIAVIAEDCRVALSGGCRVFFMGNGGSFADSIHLAAEFVSRFKFDRAPLPAIALGTNGSSTTAIGNDYGYDELFLRELSAFARGGDVVVALSTSGNSPNIVKAVEWAVEEGITCHGLSGAAGGRLATICQTICVPSSETARIQETHITIGHAICGAVEQAIFST
jgi:D-sedoheptulose 7-phosphate isomerase